MIARGNVRLVRLVPIESQGRRAFGVLNSRISVDERFNDSLPEDKIEEWNPA
ncbi:hypothetical protein [Novosphingobium sediminicola]|uniref:Uncharacterized protein n=1 Tax=Novosphingobium sediminicola TaxID=563162 RepID=A0A7W6G8S9_9SPHN|nr:hypothetical protein [Novosphingobium sediminicola]MBB3957703.1 hypothetical protein [Novosphingobium sediminicola]